MNIFVFEDNFFRRMWFIDKYVGDNVVCTDDMEVARENLSSTLFDLIFLDHDLGDNNPCTGLDVAKMIHTTKNKDSNIVVHSMNVIAADRMYDEMVENGCKNVRKIMYCEFAGS